MLLSLSLSLSLSHGDPAKSSYEDITSSQTLHSGEATPHTVGARKQQFPEVALFLFLFLCLPE